MNLNIDVGEIRLTINNDEKRELVFNPTDLNFVDRFYSLIGEFENKEKEYTKRAEEIDKNKELDSYGIPKNAGERLALMKDTCEYMRDKIDEVFGKGTSKTVFADALSMDMFTQFFEGITPYIQKTRDEKIEKYTANREQRRAVMK